MLCGRRRAGRRAVVFMERAMPSKVEAEVAGKVWKIETEVGRRVEAEDTLIIIESMKMEIPVAAPRAGTVAEIRVGEGDAVAEGQVVVILD
jgi:acetyl-CoA carboxylase biotin carboxyl carrier protein